jgi:hypothetical protein
MTIPQQPPVLIEDKPPPPNGYPCVSVQIGNMLLVGRRAYRSGLTELAANQFEQIAALASEFIYAPAEPRQFVIVKERSEAL